MRKKNNCPKKKKKPSPLPGSSLSFFLSTLHRQIKNTYRPSNSQFLGTFLEPIPPNATWTYYAHYDSSPNHEVGTIDFCSWMDSIEQPPPDPPHHPRQQSCPPGKGPATIMTSAWVAPLFIGPVNCSVPSIYFTSSSSSSSISGKR